MAKETIIKMKREPIIWENILANDVSDKGLIFNTYKELIWLNSRKTNNPIKKWAKHLNTLLHAGHTGGPCTYEKMISITSHQRNAIQTTMRYHLTPVRMAIIKQQTSAGEDVEKRDPYGAATVENSMEFPQKTRNGIGFCPSNSAAGNIS